jgi:hypothetical protein
MVIEQMVIENLLETGEGLPVSIAQAEHPVVAVNVE